MRGGEGVRLLREVFLSSLLLSCPGGVASPDWVKNLSKIIATVIIFVIAIVIIIVTAIAIATITISFSTLV